MTLAWLGVEGATRNDSVSHFLQHGGFFKVKKLRNARHLIWCASCCLEYLVIKKQNFIPGITSSYI